MDLHAACGGFGREGRHYLVVESWFSSSVAGQESGYEKTSEGLAASDTVLIRERKVTVHHVLPATIRHNRARGKHHRATSNV